LSELAGPLGHGFWRVDVRRAFGRGLFCRYEQSDIAVVVGPGRERRPAGGVADSTGLMGRSCFGGENTFGWGAVKA
jgi:hypothetical protein